MKTFSLGELFKGALEAEEVFDIDELDDTMSLSSIPNYPPALLQALRDRGEGLEVEASAMGYELKYSDENFRLWVCTEDAPVYMFVEYYNGKSWHEYIHYNRDCKGTYV